MRPYAVFPSETGAPSQRTAARGIESAAGFPEVRVTVGCYLSPVVSSECGE